MLTVKYAQLKFTPEGVPCSKLFDDPYFSLKDASLESRYVFIQGNNLPERWKQNQKTAQHFIIAELGFGFGINFIASCEEWFKHGHKTHLHYISFEKYPVCKNDLNNYHRKLNTSPTISKQLIDHYPLPVQGTHRIHFDNLAITLTLIFGDAHEYLARSEFLAHAWYLDGFSPSKNPQLWNKEISRQVYRLTHKDGTLATYSAASAVKHNLTDAGFEIRKISGFDKKREMLTGIKTKNNKQQLHYQFKNWLNTQPQPYKSKSVVIIGAGLSGCFISAALAMRGWNITLVDKHSSVANESSGNPNAILMPRLSIDHDLQSQLTLQGFLYSQRLFKQLSLTSSFQWKQVGAIQLPRDDMQWKRMQDIVTIHAPPDELISAVSKLEASELSACDLSKSGWYIPLAGHLDPVLLCNVLLTKYQDKITFIGNCDIQTISSSNNTWTAIDENNKSYSADNVILANAISINQFQQSAWCSLNPKRGQISYIPKNKCNVSPKKIICADAYVTPVVDSNLIVGATFITGDNQIDIREHEHQENLNKLVSLIPSFKYDQEVLSLKQLSGRAAIRAVSHDRMPMVGPVSIEDEFYKDYKHAALGATNCYYPTSQVYQGLYIFSGFGSRGLAWIPLCSEALASMINHEPLPIDNQLSHAIHPNRLLMKKLIQTVNS